MSWRRTQLCVHLKRHLISLVVPLIGGSNKGLVIGARMHSELLSGWLADDPNVPNSGLDGVCIQC